MLRKLSAALLATALIAGPAFAAEPASNTTSQPAAMATDHSAAKPAHSTAKTIKHTRKHAVRHVTKKTKRVHVAKVSKTHRHHIALHKTPKPGTTNQTNKSSNTAKPTSSTHG